MADRDQGYGLFPREGIGFRDATGYITRKSAYGCQPIWPGYFADRFMGTIANPTFPATAFGPAWTVDWNAAHDDQRSTNATGYLTGAGNFPGWMHASCATIPTLADHYAECYTDYLNFSFAGAVGHTPGNFHPNYGGGPGVAFKTLGGPTYRALGYHVSADNTQSSLYPNLSFRVQLFSTEWAFSPANDSETTLVTYDHTGFTDYVDSLGQTWGNWTAASHKLRLEVYYLASNNNRCKVYLDGTLVIDYTDTRGTVTQSGYFGIKTHNTSKLSKFIGGSL